MSSHSILRATGVVVLLTLGVLRVGSGQSSSGLEGRVVDEVGRPLGAAQVIVERRDGAFAAQAETNPDGGWRITHLEPGGYRVTARRVGFRAASQEVALERGRVRRLDFVLAVVAHPLDSLVVSAPRVSISTRDVELGTRLTEREIALLPTTLDVRPLIALTPGARPDQIWGGASDQANSYLLDGALVNHPGTGGFFFLPSPSWIESLAVRGLGAGAEQGNFQGGLVEVVTRSGGNRLEGGLRTSFESHRFNASNLIPGEIGREVGGRWDLDAQLRGPLVRDRLHFAVFGHLIHEDGRVLNQLPGSSEDFVRDPPGLSDYRGLGKLSWQAGRRDGFSLSVLGRVLDGERTGQTGFEALEATERLRQRSLTGSVGWQRSWSPRNALEVRLGGFTATERREPFAGTGVPGIETIATVDPAGYQNAPFRTRSEPANLTLTATWSLRGRVAAMEHELKLGGEYGLGWWRYEQVRNGGMTWRPFLTDSFDPANPDTWAVGAVQSTWGGEVRIDSEVQNGALFLQDDVTLTSWLHLNPGLRIGRWSGSLTPRSGERFTAVQTTALDPRIGLVLDLSRSGLFVAKAHWGRYHQSLFAAMFDRAAGADAYNNEELWSYRGTLTSPTTTFSLAERSALEAAGVFTLREVNRLEAVGRVENYRQPYVEQALLSLERTFGSGWKASAVYLRRRNENMVALRDLNLESNYTIVESVLIGDRFGKQLYLDGKPFRLRRVALSNEDVIRTWNIYKAGGFAGQGFSQYFLPPGLSPQELDALRYEPDFVLTTVPEATRKLEQLQLRIDARQRTWWAGASAVFSSLDGNINVVTGPDDYTNGGPGPWVRLNEQFNFFGALNNQSEIEFKLHGGGLLPAGLRVGASVYYFTGDRVTQTIPISSSLTSYLLAIPNPDGTPPADTLALYDQLFRTTSGHRVFIEPRGSYRYNGRASLDLHVERSFARGASELILAVDAFNVFNDRSVVAIQTAVNTFATFFESDYGRVRGRAPPRTLRLGASWRF